MTRHPASGPIRIACAIKAAIVIEEDGKAVTKIRAGLEPAVDYVEVCL
jgi:hypothetical protein